MSRNSPRILFALSFLALLGASAQAQLTRWPNSISMSYEWTSQGPEIVHLRVGPVAPYSELAFILLPGQLVHVGKAGPDGMFDAGFLREMAPLGGEVAVYSLSSGVGRFEGAFIANPRFFTEPERPSLGSLDISVFPNRTIVLNGPGSADNETYFTHRPLVTALRHARPGDVIGVFGDVTVGDGEAMWIGGAQDPFKFHHVHWGDTPMSFAVVGMTPNAKITGFAIAKGIASTGEDTGGVGDVIFSNLTIENYRHGASAIAGNKGEPFGRLRLYDCHFQAHPDALAEGAFYGFGAKWWIRIPSQGNYDVRNCSFDRVQEHCIYIDSPRGDNFFVGIEHNGSWRTAIQIVNRAWELPRPPQGSTQAESDAWFAALLAEYESGEKQPLPSGRGRILIKDLTLRDLWGEGGSGITIVGFLGDVTLQNIRAVDGAPFHGVITAWTDAGASHGVHAYTGADGHLYTTRSVTLIGVDVDLTQADRDHVVISGVEEVHVFDFDISGNRSAIGLDSPFGVADLSGKLAVVDGVVRRLPAVGNHTILNGNVEFYVNRPVSQFSGFRSAGKVKVWDYALPDQEIDARWP